MPADMTAAAKNVWRRVMATMGHTGVIRGADADVLRCYCEAVARYAQAARLYAQAGPLVRRDGNLVKTPLHQVVRDNADQVRLFARELGLSPAARVGLEIAAEDPMNALRDDIGLPPRLRVVGGDG